MPIINDAIRIYLSAGDDATNNNNSVSWHHLMMID
jgi:hypothetical protein